jgi:hypothetical protein
MSLCPQQPRPCPGPRPPLHGTSFSRALWLSFSLVSVKVCLFWNHTQLLSCLSCRLVTQLFLAMPWHKLQFQPLCRSIFDELFLPQTGSSLILSGKLPDLQFILLLRRGTNLPFCCSHPNLHCFDSAPRIELLHMSHIKSAPLGILESSLFLGTALPPGQHLWATVSGIGSDEGAGVGQMGL